MPPQSTPFTEARTVENPILKWLRSPELGWRYEPQKQVIKKYRTDPVTGVYDEREVLLLPLLRQKLKELNPGVITDDDRADRIIIQLRKEKDNQEWLRWLRNEKDFQFAPDEKSQIITLIDYGDIGNNDFLATNQFWVEGANGKRRRTDALLFINGISDCECRGQNHHAGRPYRMARGRKANGRLSAGRAAALLLECVLLRHQ